MTSKKFSPWLIAIAILIIFIVQAIGSYNSLVQADEKVKTAWSQVETVYQRRFDLIPNLVATVKGSAQLEEDIFLGIAEARTRYSGATSVSEQVEAAGQFESAFARLMVIVENYPEVKSTQQFQDLMTQLEGTENRLTVERQRYNQEAGSFNTRIRKFPTSMYARFFGFGAYDRFEAAAGADVAPKVEF